MKNEKYDEIVLILDKSGSMDSIKSTAISSANEFIQSQKKGNVKFTFVTFSGKDNINKLFDRVDIYEINKITENDYIPNGLTAMNDAIYFTLTELENKISKEEIKPSNMIVCIITDGEENNSITTKSVVKEFITTKKNQNWKFIFMGVDLEASFDKIVSDYNFSVNDSLCVTRDNYSRGIVTLSNNVTNSRTVE